MQNRWLTILCMSYLNVLAYQGNSVWSMADKYAVYEGLDLHFMLANQCSAAHTTCAFCQDQVYQGCHSQTHSAIVII